MAITFTSDYSCLTFVGASSESTGGGIKISRIVMYCKSARKELRKHYILIV